MQINGGKNDRFVAYADSGALVMGHYDGSKLPLWGIAKRYTLADNFFMGAFGGSFLNHFWLVCACTARFPEAPESMRVHLDTNGKLTKTSTSPSAKNGAVHTLSDILGVVSPENARARLSRSENRGKSFSALGELLWYLSGRNDLSFIKEYVAAYEKDADRDGTIHGGYGPRLFAMRGTVNQIASI